MDLIAGREDVRLFACRDGYLVELRQPKHILIGMAVTLVTPVCEKVDNFTALEFCQGRFCASPFLVCCAFCPSHRVRTTNLRVLNS
jgi:hypothetical protein